MGATLVEAVCNGIHRGARTVAQHHRGARVVKSFTKCRSNPAARTCDNSDGTEKVHSTMLRGTCVSIIMEETRDSLSS